jgi:hypothetical protein
MAITSPYVRMTGPLSDAATTISWTWISHFGSELHCFAQLQLNPARGKASENHPVVGCGASPHTHPTHGKVIDLVFGENLASATAKPLKT